MPSKIVWCWPGWNPNRTIVPQAVKTDCLQQMLSGMELMKWLEAVVCFAKLSSSRFYQHDYRLHEGIAKCWCKPKNLPNKQNKKF